MGATKMVRCRETDPAGSDQTQYRNVTVNMDDLSWAVSKAMQEATPALAKTMGEEVGRALQASIENSIGKIILRGAWVGIVGMLTWVGIKSGGVKIP